MTPPDEIPDDVLKRAGEMLKEDIDSDDEFDLRNAYGNIIYRLNPDQEYASQVDEGEEFSGEKPPLWKYEADVIEAELERRGIGIN